MSLSHAVACRILTPAEAEAIENAVSDHGDGVLEVNVFGLPDEDIKVLQRFLDWHRHTQECGL